MHHTLILGYNINSKMKKALVALCLLCLFLSVNGNGAAGGAIFLGVLVMIETFVIIGLLVSVTVILYFIMMKNKNEPDSVLASHKQQAPPKPPKVAPSTTIDDQVAHVDHSTNWAERCTSSPMKQAPPKPLRTPSTMIDNEVPRSVIEQSPVEPQEGATTCPDIDHTASSSYVHHQKSNDSNNILL
ncbi:PREDICTED: uncharacterized protein LOC109581668 [Amphimedon queenslandica]|uniref:Uncharacterized protein n=2 Tax=Amphimedon queenslandica TaxID=400682 RepID=A0AAN0J3C2_AMPQE|nr:PREDICTED: uncharacterized protein LOC109581668 [Amphimedon queenslandica]|eukprot:XP_019851544.1 PREDICTED: uncharacterized protein LOC109581668 [Amphimedon queenslandica]